MRQEKPLNASEIKLIVADVDGTLTDGSISILPDGSEMKTFSCKDGPAVRIAAYDGIKIVLVTGRKSPAIEKRADELRIEVLYKKDYDDLIGHIMSDYGVKEHEIAYIGDGLDDIQYFERVGYVFCPKDAEPEVAQLAGKQTQARGGKGVLSEVVRHILVKKGAHKDALRKLIAKEEV